MEITNEMVEVACLAYGPRSFSRRMRKALEDVLVLIEAEIPIPTVREFSSLGDPHYIKGRGPAFNIIQPDPKVQPNEIIRMNGNLERVSGIASYSDIGGDNPGRPVSVIVEVQPWRAKLYAIVKAIEPEEAA